MVALIALLVFAWGIAQGPWSPRGNEQRQAPVSETSAVEAPDEIESEFDPEGPSSVGNEISELVLADGAQRVTVPWNAKEYICPACEQPIPNRRLIYLAKPPKYAHVLNDVLKCPSRLPSGAPCRFVFSPRSDVVVLRE
jgi:hypothetical protein